MRIVLLSLSTMVALTLSVAELSAQTCRGAAPVDSVAPYQVGGGIAFSETVTGFFGTFLGGNASVFGGARLGRNSYDEPGVAATQLDLLVGGQLAADPERKMVICPEAGWSRESGPRDAGGIDRSSRQLRGGFSLGLVAAETETVRIVPAFGVSIARLRTTMDVDTEVLSSSSTLAIVEIGGGIVMSNGLSIVPSVAIPFGRQGAEATFTLAGTLSLGR